ncbi:hypothetical protein H257_07138 [Aphanomyces astaci]|uniref:Uncharacterized protein n=3 Tax=Aphanomyces astaci TaxID=112090 RepID=W4GLL9_APHAT|nr:hypothetical protein H257_07138 [Aphanomyces astaci]ETV79939.1 hypothetical protein H257_07138 [Aphanomyces astaci]RHY77651.1 hypothetical protein DYB38_002839 [Aphanomyces astaci]RHZ14462.1 hypothetical protein DYB26_006915 [Aphanomyces astaci]RHZ39916.1 hypothetical protein DYB31_006857 [Aphanomyces astaci]RQM28511.1 hypothetical protein B5M09_007789 [Aphanomyces astaci]|eukprot:XP_009830875.1 hypothetical protein H257_07138 [Aphanomyces astaci]
MVDNMEAAELLLSLLFGLASVTYGYCVIQFVMVVFSIMGFLAVAKSYGVERMATFYVALLYFVAFFVVFPYVPVRYHEIAFIIAKFALHAGALGWTVQLLFEVLPEFYLASMAVSVMVSAWIWGYLHHTARVCLIFTTSILGSLVVAGAVQDWAVHDNIVVLASDWFHLGNAVFFTIVGVFFQLKGTQEPLERPANFEFVMRPSVAATEMSDVDLPSTPHSPTHGFVTVPYVEVVVHPDVQIPQPPYVPPSSLPEEVEANVEVPPSKSTAVVQSTVL